MVGEFMDNSASTSKYFSYRWAKNTLKNAIAFDDNVLWLFMLFCGIINYAGGKWEDAKKDIASTA